MFQLSHQIRFTPFAALLMLLSSCGHGNPDIKGGSHGPVRVKAIPAMQSADAVAYSYSGTVEAGSSTTPSFSVAGTITQICVTEGQRVSKGQLIAGIDGSSMKNSYEMSMAALREAQDAYGRMKKLHDANALPDMQWVSVQEKLKQAEAAVAIARNGMNDTKLYAPISGVVAHKSADVGQTVAPGIPIVEIMDVRTLKVKISVPESDLVNLKTGASATIAAADRTYAGKLVEKGVVANSLSRNYDVKFVITTPDCRLLPGMICSVTVEEITPATDVAQMTGTVLPPQAVALDWDNCSYVWVKKNGVAQRQKVDVGGFDARGVVILSGITPADSVIVEGQQKLSVGLEVVSVN